jgi:hypothetical protein
VSLGIIKGITSDKPQTVEAAAQKILGGGSRLYWISYDLRSERSSDIIGRLEALEAKHVLESDWLVENSLTAAEVYDDLVGHVEKAIDRLMVAELCDNAKFSLPERKSLVAERVVRSLFDRCACVCRDRISK